MSYQIKGFMINGEGSSEYYIHRHKAHFNMKGAAKAFDQQKREGYEKAKARYKSNYIESISGISETAKQRLNDAMNEDEILRDLDKEFLETLNKTMTDSIKSFKLEDMLKSAYTNLDKITGKDDLKEINELFENISEASELLNKNRSEVTKILKASGFLNGGGGGSLAKLYQLGNAQLAEWEGKTLSESKTRMKSTLKSLTNMTGAIIGGGAKSSSMQGYIRNIFSTQVGEYVVSRGIGEACGLLKREIDRTLVGTKKAKGGRDDLDQILKNFGQRGNQDFKTDNRFKNFKMELKDSKDSFNIQLGLTTKWYKNIGSGNSSNVAITSEKSFANRIDQLVRSPGERYNAYNSLGLVGQDESGYQALKAAIVARNIDVFISGIGFQGDFSQFLVINGNFISIMDIVNSVEKFNDGGGSSNFNTVKTDPVTISANGLTKVKNLTEDADEEEANLIRAYIRCKEQAKLINGLSLTGHFYPNRLDKILNGEFKI